MVRQKANRQQNQPDENIYLSNLEQDSWNDIQAYHIENESAWRILAILAIMALVIVSIFAMNITNQDKHKIIVFEKDGLGNLTTLGIASKTFAVDNKIIAHQLANFIMALREVPKDTVQKRRNIDMLHKMIDTKIRANVDQMLIKQYTRAQDGQITVVLNQIKPLEGGKSWVIGWSEEENLQDIKDVGKVRHYSSVITFNRQDNVDLQTQLINPVGLIVTYLNLVEDVNDKQI